MGKFFWSKASGINADIDRHRKKERELQDQIAQLEQRDQSDPMVRASLRAYRRFLYQLELSKADAVDKIGRK